MVRHKTAFGALATGRPQTALGVLSSCPTGGKRLCRQARHVPRKSCLLDVHSKALSLAPQLPVGPRFRSHTPFVDDHTLRSRELWEKVMSALQNFSGGCACGAVHYETTVDPVLMLNCHCRDCQQASGSAYAPLVIFRKAACGCTASFVIVLA